MRAATAILSLGALLVGCGDTVTEVVVVADTDLQVPRDVDAIHFQVDASGVGGQVVEATADLRADDIDLPVVLPLVHEGGPLGPVTVTAIALRAGDPVVSRSARFDFVRGRSVILRMDLLAGCVDTACEPGETCGEGGCRPVDVRPSTPDAGVPPQDAGGGPDAGPLCPIGCPCVQDCTATDCECVGGCACDLSCDVASDCGKVRCDGAGTDCTLDARDAEDAEDVRCDHGARCTIDVRGNSNVSVLCDHDSSCDVDCTGVSNCTVECKGGSRCTVECAGVSNCELKGCSGETSTCGTVTSCRTPCA